MTKSPPAQLDILCENCGYILNGLPPSGDCPECGQPVAQSVANDGRAPSAWEDDSIARIPAFLRTTLAVILRPGRFYRSTLARGGLDRPLQFARLHWMIASLMFAAAARMHANWIDDYRRPLWKAHWPLLIIEWLFISIMIYFLMQLTTKLAARLTAFEASYRGIRLPRTAVSRALYFHAAHFTPVALLAVLTVDGYSQLVTHAIVESSTVVIYLYVLSAEVILCAGYLFLTYWAGMKNIMYANR